MANPMVQKSLVIIPSAKRIVNYCSGGGVSTLLATTGVHADNGVSKIALSGALTGNVLTNVLSISGAGYLITAAASSVDATSRTHRIKITIDGVVAFDATTNAVTAANRGIIAVGANDYAGGTTILVPQNIRFNTSCLVQYASSVSETDKSNIFYSYITE